MLETLNIPLQENPTRQKLWRVVVFVAPILLAATLSILAVRLFETIDTITSLAPADTEFTVRLVKTPKTAEVTENQFHGAVLLPNAPYTLDQLSRWSKRSSAIFLGNSGVLGVAIAGQVPDSTKAEAQALGLVVVDRFGGTYIGTTPPVSTKFGLRMPLSLVWPWFNGEVIVKNTNKAAPLRLTENSLTISGLGRTKTSASTQIDQSLAKISVTPDEAINLLGFDVPLIFPGLNELEKQMMSQGFVLTLGMDDQGTPYSITVPEGNLSKEDLESMVSELYYTKTLVTEQNEGDYATFNEIVSTSTSKPVTTSDPRATVSSIEDNSGAIVRAAQTSHSLVLANRPVTVGTKETNQSAKNSCLPSANQWLNIAELKKLLPALLSTPGWTITQKVTNSQQIAFSKNKTRVCW